jgi:hypothetical protein
MKYIFGFIQFFPLLLFAQFNPSFEQYDSLNQLVGWKTISGSYTKSSLQLVNGLPFTAPDGNYFLSAMHDTLTPKAAVIVNTFAYNDTPASMYFQAFYVPGALQHKGKITLHFFQQNGDTILHEQKEILPVTNPSNPNKVLVQWNRMAINLAGKYRTNELPDSVRITITDDDAAIPVSGAPIFFIDDFEFGQFAVGLANHNQDNYFDISPNPAKDFIRIQADRPISNINIFNELGSQINTYQSNEERDLLVNISALPAGIYIVAIQTDRGVNYQKLLIY